MFIILDIQNYYSWVYFRRIYKLMIYVFQNAIILKILLVFRGYILCNIQLGQDQERNNTFRGLFILTRLLIIYIIIIIRWRPSIKVCWILRIVAYLFDTKVSCVLVCVHFYILFHVLLCVLDKYMIWRSTLLTRFLLGR
jgi:hypothetical protein